MKTALAFAKTKKFIIPAIVTLVLATTAVGVALLKGSDVLAGNEGIPDLEG